MRNQNWDVPASDPHGNTLDLGGSHPDDPPYVYLMTESDGPMFGLLPGGKRVSTGFVVESVEVLDQVIARLQELREGMTR